MLDEVTVDRDKLLETLIENRDKHVGEYEAAVEKYREDAEKALRKRAIEIRDGKTLKSGIDLPEPVSFKDDYDRAIAMVEWSNQKTITLTDHAFKAYVLDQWAWRGAFAASTSIYNAR